MLIYISIYHICRCGGIGRRTRLKIVRETMWVRVPPSVPNDKSLINIEISIFFVLVAILIYGTYLIYKEVKKKVIENERIEEKEELD